MRIALIGTRGVPARYGGFETAIEEVGQRLVRLGHEVVVFCRSAPDQAQPDEYLGMRLIWLPAVRRSSVETLSHTALSVLSRALHGVDAAIVFNAANSPLLPVLRARGIPVATHVDGLEWKRAKWGPLGQRYYRLAERLAVWWSDALIADARGIADYYAEKFSVATHEIAYGAPILTDPGSDRLDELNLRPQGYHLVVARFEPENHVREIVTGYVASAASLPLVVVGTAPYADEYIQAVHDLADARVRFLGAVWDQEQLDQLYANSLTYLHGHSVGGTNPSLLRAAGAGAHVLAWDVNFNREVVGEHGGFFADPATLATLLEAAEVDPVRTRSAGKSLQAAIRRYDWDDVAARYEQLCRDLVARRAGRALEPTGPRILVAHPSSDLYGSDRVLLETASGLVESGAEVTVALPGPGALVEPLRALGARVVECPVPVIRRSALSPAGLLGLMVQSIRSFPRMTRLAARYGRDGVHVNTVAIPLWLLAGRVRGRRVTCHVHEAESTLPPLIRRFLATPVRLAHAVIVNSRFTLEVLLASAPRLAARTTVILNAVPGPNQVVAPRSELSSPVQLLFVGRLSPRKGPQVALQSVRQLLARGHDVAFTLVGSAFTGYEWFEQELRDVAADPQLAGRVRFAGFDSDIWPWLAESDIAVVPALMDESFGNTAVEALLAERPVIVSDISGLREATTGYHSAVRCAAGDADALTDAVAGIISAWPTIREAVPEDRELARRRHDPAVYRAAVARAIRGADAAVSA